MTKAKLLIVDDDLTLLTQLKHFLSDYEVATASDGNQALAIIPEAHPDMIILDVMMPGIDGWEVLYRLRQSKNPTPVIMLSNKTGPGPHAEFLKWGADDYIDKPFDHVELEARVSAVLRRTGTRQLALERYPCLRSGRLALNCRTHQLRLDGEERTCKHHHKALGVLEYLMLHPGEVISRDQLLDKVWGSKFVVVLRLVDICIHELRHALDDDARHPSFIETVHGDGYRFIPKVEGGED